MTTVALPIQQERLHDWVKPITVCFVENKSNKRLDRITSALEKWFQDNGHIVQRMPDASTQLFITTMRGADVVDRPDALLLNGKRRYQLPHRPQVLTLVDLTTEQFEERQRYIDALADLPYTAAHTVEIPGLGRKGSEVIHQQRRRHDLVGMARLLQGQAISIRVMGLVGDEKWPDYGLHIDLAGAYATIPFKGPKDFIANIGGRIATFLNTVDVKEHIYLDELLASQDWETSETPNDLVRAGNTFTDYGFFTDPVDVVKLLGFRGLGDAIAAQYSEGCYATYDPLIGGLVTTATGSAKFVDKRAITRGDTTLITGVKPNRMGALVRGIEGRPDIAPSVEAVELFGICEMSGVEEDPLGESRPRIRSLLHGHIGVKSFAPERVERVVLDKSFYAYPVSCGTNILADATGKAFAKAQALSSANDPRKVIFIEQPCHGIVVVERWVQGMRPFEAIEQALQEGWLVMQSHVPQSLSEYPV